MSRVLLITGATGKQGGSVIDSLLELPNTSDFTILAVTRDANSGSAKKLAGRASNIKLVEGNLDDVPALFQAADKVAQQPIWGVYSVQISMGKGVTFEGEVKQGTDLIDESVKNGVTPESFAYSGEGARLPSLKGIMAAKKKAIEERPAELGEPNVQRVALELPPPRKPGRIVGQGTAAIPDLLKALREEAKVL